MFEATSSKLELLSLVKSLAIPPVYACRHIAEQFGHQLRYLPPYHPELNIIEQIWAVAKGLIGRQAPKSREEFHDFIEIALLDEVTTHTWLGSWLKSIKIAQTYVQEANLDAVVVDADEQSSSDESGDDDGNDELSRSPSPDDSTE